MDADDEEVLANGCCGVFVLGVLVVPIGLVLAYIMWKWALSTMGVL